MSSTPGPPALAPVSGRLVYRNWASYAAGCRRTSPPYGPGSRSPTRSFCPPGVSAISTPSRSTSGSFLISLSCAYLTLRHDATYRASSPTGAPWRTHCALHVATATADAGKRDPELGRDLAGRLDFATLERMPASSVTQHLSRRHARPAPENPNRRRNLAPSPGALDDRGAGASPHSWPDRAQSP